MRHPPLTEQKLLLLYAFDAVGDMSAAQVTRFLIENAVMDYIDARLALAELEEAEHIVRDGDEDAPYALTPAGRKTLELFKGRIPASKGERVSDAAARWRALFVREGALRARVRKLAAGTYEVALRFRERDVDLLQIELIASDRAEAEHMCAAWQENAASIYRLIVDKLAFSDENK